MLYIDPQPLTTKKLIKKQPNLISNAAYIHTYIYMCVCACVCIPQVVHCSGCIWSRFCDKQHHRLTTCQWNEQSCHKPCTSVGFRWKPYFILFQTQKLNRKYEKMVLGNKENNKRICFVQTSARNHTRSSISLYQNLCILQTTDPPICFLTLHLFLANSKGRLKVQNEMGLMSGEGEFAGCKKDTWWDFHSFWIMCRKISGLIVGGGFNSGITNKNKDLSLKESYKPSFICVVGIVK